MNTERIFAILLGAALVGALLWRFTPSHGAPVDTAVSLAAGTMGVEPVAPTLDAAEVVGMSYGPGDGEPGPAVYCAAYPGVRPPMPPIPSAIKRG